MKNYTITVNGTAYSVTVEEGQASAPAAAPKAAPAPAAAPKAAPAPAPAPAAQGAAGSVEVNATVPGKVLNIPAHIGDTLKAGDPIVVLESMKMEIPGDLLATMN